MKKIHIILLVFIAGTIALLISFLDTGSTYDTIAEAKSKSGKFSHVAVRRDTTTKVEYEPLKDPNYLSFYAVGIEDPTEKMRVVYRGGPIENLMISERLVLKGKYENDHFECKDVQTKCPSKYKEEMKAPQNSSVEQTLKKGIEQNAVTNTAPTSTEATKY